MKPTYYQLMAKRSDHKTAHLLHLVLSLITAGVWVPFWILVTISHANERRKIDKQMAKIDGAQL